MKLADKYVRADCTIDHNVVYRHYQDVIDQALRSPGGIAPSAVHVDATAFLYTMPPEQEEFYRDLFIPSEPVANPNDPTLIKYFGPDYMKHLKIDQCEIRMLDYLTGDPRALILISPIGWGKTVLLKHLWFDLARSSPVLTSQLVPVYLCLDHWKSALESFSNAAEIQPYLESDVLRPALMHALRNFIDVYDEALWDYLKQWPEFAELSLQEKWLKSMFSSETSDSAGNLRERIGEGRLSALLLKAFPYCALAYVRERSNKTPLVILDNVDPLSGDVHRSVVPLATTLAEQFGIRCILSMRPIAYNMLQREGFVETYRPSSLTMKQRSLRPYIQARTNSVLSGARLKPLRVIDDKGVHISQSDAVSVLQRFIDILLTADCERALDYLAFHNLHLVNEMIRTYLATGYLNHDRVVWEILRRSVTEKSDYDSPLWVMLSSLITWNHLTCFSDQHADIQNDLDIINLFCNHTLGVNDHFIRLHILNYLCRQPRNRGTRIELYHLYGQLFANEPPRLRTSLDHALYRLLKCRLVVSPEYDTLDRSEKCDRIVSLEVTNTGEYFLRTLCSYYEYLVYLKDDTELGTNPRGIRDSVVERRLAERYCELYKFLELIYDEEHDFLGTCIPVERRSVFKDNFSSVIDSQIYMVAAPCRAMVEFGNRHELPRATIDRFSRIVERMDTLGQSYVPPAPASRTSVPPLLQEQVDVVGSRTQAARDN